MEDILEEEDKENSCDKGDEKSSGEEGEENSSEDESNKDNAFEDEEKRSREKDKEKVAGKEKGQDCSDEEDEEKDKEKSVGGKGQDNSDEGEEKDREKHGEEDEESRQEKNEGKETPTQQSFTKPLLATSEKHRQLREQSDEFYRRNAEQMQQKYMKAKQKKVITFSVGDFVSVRIPRIDRSSTDFHRMVCIVVEKLGQKCHLYRLRYTMHDVFYYTGD